MAVQTKEVRGPRLILEVRVAHATDVYSVLESRATGLTGDEVAERLQQYGPNVLQQVKGTPLWIKFVGNFTHLMALLLWVGGVVGFIAGLPELGIAIWMVNVINGLFSFWQEFRAERATEALRKMLPQNVRVIRDGTEQKILAEEMVPGDVVVFEEGDKISADARLVQASELRIDQSTLTGESVPVRKLENSVPDKELTPAEVPNLVFAGTNVAAGTGRAVVFATGMNTEFGKIARLTQGMEEAPSPLQRELEVVTRRVTYIAVGVGVLFFFLAVALAGMQLAEGFIFTLGMIVAFVPEGLLPTVTLSLAMGVQRMAKRNALIKKLSSVETLGCTSVICTDKTGTLTQNAMTVHDMWISGQRLKVSGRGLEPVGDVTFDGKALSGALQADTQFMVTAAGLVNNSRLLPPDADHLTWTIIGDPTEAALRVAAPKLGVDLERAAVEQVRVRELPFESRRKRMSTVHQVRDESSGQLRYVAYVKGAPNEILALSSHVRRDGQDVPMTPALREEIYQVNDEYARSGLRVLAIAARPLPVEGGRAPLSSFTVETVEQELTLLGLMAMMDPPRPEVAEAVHRCQTAGIRVIMITGDYGLTAESIARRVGIVHTEQPRIVTGTELDKMSDADLHAVLQNEVIFARVAPEHKLKVVSALQDLGEVVAVTGDGVNDAPALKKADIGVAMGIAGTDVAKEAADVILTDDNFASIVNAVEEGRGVYANIKKFATYIFTSNTPEAVPFIIYAFSGGAIPLAITIMQVLAIDLGTDLVPALGLGVEKPEPGIMNQPPRRLSDHLITRGMLMRAYVWLGPVQSLAAMAAFFFFYWTNGFPAWQFTGLPDSGSIYHAATAMALAAVVTTQIGNVFTQRTERTSITKIPLFSNRLIWIGVAVELVLVAIIIYTPIGQRIFGTDSFPLYYWIFLFAWTPSLVIVDEVRKYLVRRRERRSEPMASASAVA
ncbi:MAG: cation-transporting P-type ATPase [Anaerolineae bacterium]